MTETADTIRAEIALLREQVAQRVARLNELRVRDICECGHARYRHGQGCEVSGCHCPYFERTNPADCFGHMWSIPRDGTRECLWCSARETIDGSHARESVSTAGGVHDDSLNQSAAPVNTLYNVNSTVCTHQWTAATDGSSACAICGLYLATIQGPVGGLTDYALANLKQVEQVVELGPRTLRALLAVLGRSVDYGFDLSLPDALLAELARTEEK